MLTKSELRAELPPPLNYAQRKRSALAILRAAQWCALIPLSIGIFVFLLWLPTHWETLEVAGLITIYAGTFVITGGLIAVCIQWIVSRWRAPAPVNWWPSRQEMLVVALLLSNFVTAAAIIVAIDYFKCRFIVTVTNSCTTPFDDVAVTCPGDQAHLGPLLPNTTRSATLHLNGTAGGIEMVRRQGSQTSTDVIEGYVESDAHGNKSVTINANSVQIK